MGKRKFSKFYCVVAAARLQVAPARPDIYILLGGRPCPRGAPQGVSGLQQKGFHPDSWLDVQRHLVGLLLVSSNKL